MNFRTNLTNHNDPFSKSYIGSILLDFFILKAKFIVVTTSLFIKSIIFEECAVLKKMLRCVGFSEKLILFTKIFLLNVVNKVVE